MGCTSLLLAIPCTLVVAEEKDYFNNQVAALKVWLAETVSQRFETYCDRVIDRLKDTLYAELSPFLEPAESNDKVLWERSNGISGLWDRAKDAGWRLLLVQVCWAHGTISDQDARYVWFLVIGQFWFTLLAIPAAGLTCLISGYPRAAAKQSLSFYFRMILCVTHCAIRRMHLTRCYGCINSCRLRTVMPMIANESVQKKLLKRLEEVQAELRRREFVLYGEMELLEVQIAAAKRGSHTLFAGVGRPHAALMLCLNLRDHAMTVDEIVDMLVNGGFPMKMVSARGTINDLLNYHAGGKNIQPAKITLRRVEDRFGIAEWQDEKFLQYENKVLDVAHVGL